MAKRAFTRHRGPKHQEQTQISSLRRRLAGITQSIHSGSSTLCGATAVQSIDALRDADGLPLPLHSGMPMEKEIFNLAGVVHGALQNGAGRFTVSPIHRN